MMLKYKVGDTVRVGGRQAKVVWLSENASEIEAIDEFIVEFEDKHRQFLIRSMLDGENPQSVHDREHNSDPCYG